MLLDDEVEMDVDEEVPLEEEWEVDKEEESEVIISGDVLCEECI